MLLLLKVLFDLVDASDAVVYVLCLPAVALVLPLQRAYFVLQS